MSVGFVRKLRELYKETGDITRRPHGGGMPLKLSPDDEKAVRRWCEVQPDLAVKEYQERLRTERCQGSAIQIHLGSAKRIQVKGLTEKRVLAQLA